jgi:hypothetical protein
MTPPAPDLRPLPTRRAPSLTLVLSSPRAAADATHTATPSLPKSVRAAREKIY